MVPFTHSQFYVAVSDVIGRKAVILPLRDRPPVTALIPHLDYFKVLGGSKLVTIDREWKIS